MRGFVCWITLWHCFLQLIRAPYIDFFEQAAKVAENDRQNVRPLSSAAAELEDDLQLSLGPGWSRPSSHRYSQATPSLLQPLTATHTPSSELAEQMSQWRPVPPLRSDQTAEPHLPVSLDRPESLSPATSLTQSISPQDQASSSRSVQGPLLNAPVAILKVPSAPGAQKWPRGLREKTVSNFIERKIAKDEVGADVVANFRNRYPALGQGMQLVQLRDSKSLAYPQLVPLFDRAARKLRIFVYPKPGSTSAKVQPFIYDDMVVSVRRAKALTEDMRTWSHHFPGLNPWYKDQVLYAVLGTNIHTPVRSGDTDPSEIELYGGKVNSKLLAIVSLPWTQYNLGQDFGYNIEVPIWSANAAKARDAQQEESNSDEM
ncbi:hypothetical protein BCV70DRAFT_48034 [Testicularia cyperi]|uniref:Uncharacterized protein n=1 Tax=Testicularia cyperi TaxID=1882483 RepID=A0A317XHT1_9BASI|nr:hypothetical protein BCV70DRAFT_48034 [Testicularia cyperi]